MKIWPGLPRCSNDLVGATGLWPSRLGCHERSAMNGPVDDQSATAVPEHVPKRPQASIRARMEQMLHRLNCRFCVILKRHDSPKRIPVIFKIEPLP